MIRIAVFSLLGGEREPGNYCMCMHQENMGSQFLPNIHVALKQTYMYARLSYRNPLDTIAIQQDLCFSK